MPRMLLALALALLALLLAVPGPAAADPAEVRLIPGWREPGGGPHVAALEITLPAGWHTYWRVPGAGGIPPRFDWTGSENLAGVAFEWPRPEVFESFGVRTIGYHDRLLLPILLDPAEPGRPIDLRLALDFGVCKDICIPAQARIAAELAPDAAPEAANGRPLIEAALARRAHRASEAGVLDATCRIARNGDGHALAAIVRLKSAPARAQTAVIEAARPDIWIGEARASTDGALVTAEAHLEHAGPGGLVLDRSGLRLTLIDDTRMIDIRGCRAPD